MKNEKTINSKLILSLLNMANHQGLINCMSTGNNELDLFILNQWVRKKMNVHLLIELDYETTYYKINACEIKGEPEWLLNKIYNKYLFKNYEYALFTAINEFLKQNYL